MRLNSTVQVFLRKILRRLSQTNRARLTKRILVLVVIILGPILKLLTTDRETPNKRTSERHLATFEPIWYTEYINMHKKTVHKLREGRTDVKLLVYDCNIIAKQCGGLGDRLGGISSLLYAAVVLGRAIVVDQRRPTPLNLTMVPGTDINWDIAELVPKVKSTISLKLIDRYDTTQVAAMFREDLVNVSILRISLNRYYTGIALWSDKRCDTLPFIGSMFAIHAKHHQPNSMTASDTFAFAFNALFRPSTTVKRRITELKTSPTMKNVHGNYVAIHARLGGENGRSQASAGWSDPKRDDISDVERFINCAQNKANARSDRHILVFSDSVEFKQASRSFSTRVVYTDALTFHIDRSRSDAATTADGSVDTVAEFFILSNARCIIASYSTFSGAAASLMKARQGPCYYHFKNCHTENVDFWTETEIPLNYPVDCYSRFSEDK